MTEKIIGVLGGMGPESSAALLLRIIRATRVETEQEHLRVILDSNPKIPDRTQALLSGDTEAVIAALRATARNLERAGAEVIGIACNTAHAFLAEIQPAVGIKILNLIEETAELARRSTGPGSCHGLLATTGTVSTRLYHDALQERGLQILAPTPPAAQAALMRALTEVKVGGVTRPTADEVGATAATLINRGAVTLVAGCTEAALVFDLHPPRVPWIDPLQALAEALVREAGGSVASKGPGI